MLPSRSVLELKYVHINPDVFKCLDIKKLRLNREFFSQFAKNYVYVYSKDGSVCAASFFSVRVGLKLTFLPLKSGFGRGFVKVSPVLCRYNGC